jgi:ABC-type Fe3+-hydroxamate transport system substrate-binding protein
MKRTLLALFILSALLLAACATTTAPNVTGTISKIDGALVTVTPANGGAPAEVVLNWGTTVYQPDGVKAPGVSVLTVGQPVQVWYQSGSTTATRINIGQ